MRSTVMARIMLCNQGKQKAQLVPHAHMLTCAYAKACFARQTRSALNPFSLSTQPALPPQTTLINLTSRFLFLLISLHPLSH